jgi:hypothetical protein
VSLAVGEQVVDDHSDNGEEEDDEAPEDLVGNGAVRLKDLDYATLSVIDQSYKKSATYSKRGYQGPKQ